MQTTYFEHQPFADVPILKNIFCVSIPYPGNRRTVFQSYYPQQLSKNHVVKFTSVIRFYSNMGEFNPVDPSLGTIKAAIDIGNEGGIFMKHNRDWLDRFMRFEYADFNWSTRSETLIEINP